MSSGIILVRRIKADFKSNTQKNVERKFLGLSGAGLPVSLHPKSLDNFSGPLAPDPITGRRSASKTLFDP